MEKMRLETVFVLLPLRLEQTEFIREQMAGVVAGLLLILIVTLKEYMVFLEIFLHAEAVNFMPW